MARSPIDDVATVAQDAAYVSLGLGVLAFQRLQVRRHELHKALAAQGGEARGALELVETLVAERLKMLEERVGAALGEPVATGLYDQPVIQRVRAVVLCWNNVELIDRCVDALLDTQWPGTLDVVVVDNGSTDGSVDGWASRHPEVGLVPTGSNLGFAAGVNRGLTDLGDVDAVALVNSDAFVEPGWLTPLASALDADDGIGAACPKILFADRQEDGRPVINNVGNELGPTWELHDRGYEELDTGQFDAEEDVWGWCGAAVLLRRRYLDEVGHFDERLFMYAEDADLSWRGARRGWRYRYVPTSVVRHLHRASSGGVRTARLDVLNRRNRLVVVSRHGGRRMVAGAWARALGGIVVAIGTDVLGRLLRGRRPEVAPLRRRARAAVDAARLLAGGHPPLP